MLELLLASNEIDLTHFDGDPTLEILIQECQLVSSVAQAKPKQIVTKIIPGLIQVFI